MGIWQAFKAGAGRVASSHAAREFAENTLQREALDAGLSAASAAKYHQGKHLRMVDLMDDYYREVGKTAFQPNGLGESVANSIGYRGAKAAEFTGGIVSDPMLQGVAFTALPMAMYAMPQEQPQLTEEEYNQQIQQQYAQQQKNVYQ